MSLFHIKGNKQKYSKPLIKLELKADILIYWKYWISSVCKGPIVGNTMSRDDLYLRLIKKLAEYDSLLEQLQSSFQDGFHHLSRANYHNKDTLRGTYGRDYWDETYTGHRYVSIDGKHRIQEIAEPEYKEDQEEEDIPEKQDTEASHKLRKRKQRKTLLEKAKKNPIYMFGGALSTPMSLRQSQSSFNSSFPVIYKLIELRYELNALLDQISPSV